MIPDSALVENDNENPRRPRGFQLKKRPLTSPRYASQGKVLLADLQLDLDLERNEAFDEDTEVQEPGSAFSQVSHQSRRKLG